MVGIVTDSVADIPDSERQRLDIAMVPLRLRFGSEEYRDRIDMTSEQFYRRLRASEEFPTTSVASPAEYAEAYDRLAERCDSLLVITISARLSGTIEVARRAITLMRRSCRVEVFDSGTATLTEGFIVMKAAEAARSGASLEETIEVARRTRERVDFLCTFDTLEYLQRGGRIGAASAFLGSVLKINPLITIRDGVVVPAGRTRSRAKAVDRLVEFAAGYSTIEELTVENTDCAEEADALTERLAPYFPKERIYRSTMTPVIGVHTGPGLLVVGVLGDKA